MSWTLKKKLARKRSRAGLYIERESWTSFASFPNHEATDIVFVTLFCIAVGTAITWCCGRCAMPDGHWRRSTAALVFRVGACFEVSLFCPPFPLVPVLDRPSRLLEKDRRERPWTAARTMEVLRRCPHAIAQRLVHYAIAVSTAVLGRVTRTDNVRCTAVERPEAKLRSPNSVWHPSSTSLLMISSGLT